MRPFGPEDAIIVGAILILSVLGAVAMNKRYTRRVARQRAALKSARAKVGAGYIELPNSELARSQAAVQDTPETALPEAPADQPDQEQTVQDRIAAGTAAHEANLATKRAQWATLLAEGNRLLALALNGDTAVQDAIAKSQRIDSIDRVFSRQFARKLNRVDDYDKVCQLHRVRWQFEINQGTVDSALAGLAQTDGSLDGLWESLRLERVLEQTLSPLEPDAQTQLIAASGYKLDEAIVRITGLYQRIFDESLRLFPGRPDLRVEIIELIENSQSGEIPLSPLFDYPENWNLLIANNFPDAPLSYFDGAITTLDDSWKAILINAACLAVAGKDLAADDLRVIKAVALAYLNADASLRSSMPRAYEELGRGNIGSNWAGFNDAASLLQAIINRKPVVLASAAR